MFDSIQRPARRRPRIVLLLSIAAHAAVLTFVGLSGLWRLDKLGVDSVPLAIAGPPTGMLGAAADEPEPGPDRPEAKVADLRQQRAGKVNRTGGGKTGTSSTGTGGEGPIGIGIFREGCSTILDQAGEAPSCGNGRVEAGEECDDGNRTAGDGCSANCFHDEERIVVSRLIEGSRVEGDPQIAPPDTVQQAMVRSGVDKLSGTVKMCLDKRGRVSSLRVLRSTGHSAYDQRLLAGMRGWRYHPYKLDSGAAVPVCTVVNFIFRAQ